ncbi:MAG: hypothetical protein HPY74_05925 [Firmicutes bacterium]|nr:hypothetical protein [Bacillota bacterium]
MSQSNKGVNKLARVLLSRMKQTGSKPDILELGTIKSDYSLLTDRFPIAIPKGEYLVCRSLTLNAEQPLTITAENQGQHPHGPSGGHSQYSGDGVHSHPDTEGQHIHDVVLPDLMKPLKPGDRVLVAWVNDGTDPVVIDIVVPG